MTHSTPDPEPSPTGGPKVVYVMGAGRSGSTILGVTLGNCEDVFFAGELDKWLPRSGTPKLEDEPRVEFWERVRAAVPAGAPIFGYQAQRYLERSSALFRRGRRGVRRALRGPYLEAMGQLYRAIAETSGAGHIVDSSHYPLRAREMESVPGIELHILLLVRDPHAVVASLDRDDVPERRFGALAANAYLWLTHLMSVAVFLRHPRARRLLVSHEQFLADPQGVLGRILASVGAPAVIPDLQALRTGVPLHGNRLIADDTLALQGPGHAPARTALTGIVQLPWRIAFSLLRPSTRAGRRA